MIGKRVYDSIGADYGTVVDVDNRGRCLVEWDRRPPHVPPYIKLPASWCSFVEGQERADG